MATTMERMLGRDSLKLESAALFRKAILAAQESQDTGRFAALDSLDGYLDRHKDGLEVALSKARTGSLGEHWFHIRAWSVANPKLAAQIFP